MTCFVLIYFIAPRALPFFDFISVLITGFNKLCLLLARGSSFLQKPSDSFSHLNKSESKNVQLSFSGKVYFVLLSGCYPTSK